MNKRQQVTCKWNPTSNGLFQLHCGLWWVAVISKSTKLPNRFVWKYASGVNHNGSYGELESIDDCFELVEKMVKQDPEFEYTIENPFTGISLDKLFKT